MKFFKKLFKFILFLFFVVVALILACAFKPGLSEKVGERVTELLSFGENVKNTDVKGKWNDTIDTIVGRENVPGGNNNLSDVISENSGYISLDEKDIITPDDAFGKNGLAEFDSEDSVLTAEQEKAYALLKTGETGAELSFDSRYYPYYDMLSDDGKALYKQIYANAVICSGPFKPIISLTADNLMLVFEAVYNDHPELFFLETKYKSVFLSNGECVEISLIYNAASNDIKAAQISFETAADSIASVAKSLPDDLTKEKYVHDILINRVSYSAAAACNQSAYSALVGGKSVCAGYSRAFQYVMQKLGIPCFYCPGYSGENHAWNIINLGDNYYNVDVTWDDPDTDDGAVTYNYFNKSDAEIRDSHKRIGMSVNLPACVTAKEGDIQGSLDNVSDALEGIKDIINQNPTEPLTLENDRKPGSDVKAKNATGVVDNSENLQKTDPQVLKDMGLSPERVDSTMEEYYADCLTKMETVGAGEKTFETIINAGLWDSIEAAYASGAYKNGYLDAAMKKLGVTYCSVNLQGQKLGGGYYRIYHNLYSY